MDRIKKSGSNVWVPAPEYIELSIRLEMERLITLREGMVAINTFRSQRGEVIAYNEPEFLNLADQFQQLAAGLKRV